MTVPRLRVNGYNPQRIIPEFAQIEETADERFPINEAFFQGVDRLLQKAADLSILMAILATWGFLVTGIAVLREENDRAYGRKYT